ncbi:MAG: hypothetical protein ACI9X4_002217, partial [Glaciecola sp.]
QTPLLGQPWPKSATDVTGCAGQENAFGLCHWMGLQVGDRV